MRHHGDTSVRVSDNEFITTAFGTVLYIGGHLDNARHFVQIQDYVPQMPDKSRCCHVPVGSFPVAAVCDNRRY